MKRQHIVRPHICELLRLLPHFRLGVYSSATVHTVRNGLAAIERRMQQEADARGVGADRARMCVCV
jgi:hypothetical protein